ncbi:MAG: hypothetical protein ACP5E2_08325, partial [Terracidiphilus sp.]
MIENRNGLVVAAEATEAGNAAERNAAVRMLDRAVKAKEDRLAGEAMTLGDDTLYREEKFIEDLRQRSIAPHVSEYTQPGNNLAKNSLTEAERGDERRS